MPNPTHVTLDGTKLRLAAAEGAFRHGYQSVMVPRPDTEGAPGSENLKRHIWPLTFTDFRGGEGRLVFDRLADPREAPSFWKTDGGVDTRTPGEFSMSPTATLILDTSAATGNTTFEGNTLTDVSGTTASGSNRVYDAVNDEARTGDRTPGAVTINITARIVNVTRTSTALADTLVMRLRIRNVTDSTDDASDTFTWTVDPRSGVIKPGTSATLYASLAATAGKTYRYHVEVTTESGTWQAECDYVQEVIVTVMPISPRLHHGYADNIVMVNSETTSTVYTWDFTNDEWTAQTTIAAVVERGLTASDKFEYGLTSTQLVYQWSTGAATQYTAATGGTPVGIAVANNRLYILSLGAAPRLHEVTLDATAGLPFTENTADYKRVMTSAELPDEEATISTVGPRRICAISNGVRFFVNARGGPSIIFEFSEGTGKAIEVMPAGLVIDAIFHYGGITYIAARARSRASTPAQQRSGIWYIGGDGILRFAFHLRFDEPDDEAVTSITAWEADIYFLQGNRVWRYDGETTGVTLDRFIPSADDTLARDLAVMDNKMWIGYGTQGPFVTQDAYPTDTPVWWYSPKTDFGTDLDKVLTHLEVVTTPLPANTSVYVEYRIDEGSWTSTDKDAATMTHDTDDAAKKVFTIANTGANTKKGRILQWRIGLASSDGVSTPTVRSTTMKVLVLDYVESFDIVVSASDEDSINRGVGTQRTGTKIWSDIKTSIENKNLVSATFHYEDSRTPADVSAKTVIIEDPQGDIANEGRDGEVRLRLVVV